MAIWVSQWIEIFQLPSHGHFNVADQQRNLDLLKIACCVAWTDGDIGLDEKRSLENLVDRYVPPESCDATLEQAVSQLATWALDCSILDPVIQRLISKKDRLLAVKFAYVVA